MGNKARNQVKGDSFGAPWFKKKVAANRKANKAARKARKKGRR